MHTIENEESTYSEDILQCYCIDELLRIFYRYKGITNK